MTPLAARMLKYKHGPYASDVSLETLESLHETYVFDCTPLAENDWWSEAMQKTKRISPPPETIVGPQNVQSSMVCWDLSMFIVPAAKTWIEYVCPTTGRLTALYTRKTMNADEFLASICVAMPEGVRYLDVGRLCFEIGDWADGAIGGWTQHSSTKENMETQYGLNVDNDLAAWATCLYAINSSRSQHVPTTVPRKQRRAAQSEMKRHNITFLGCSQVHLKQAEDPRRQQTVMTAEQASKCRHKVRAHNRNLSNGKTITIPEHWRGDARKGVKDSTYIVSLDAA